MEAGRHYDSKACTRSAPRSALQKHHNQAKRALISEFAHDAERLLDLACGRGGDIAKWCDARIKEVVGLDVSKHSIEEAKERYKNAGSPYNYTFAQHDVSQGYVCDRLFDVVSCMFALHYFFGTERDAQRLMQTVASNLKPGGYFIGIVPDALRVNERIKHGPFDNGFMRVQALWEGKPACFGSKYVCNICGTVTAGSQVPEFLVYGSVLEKVASMHGLTPVPIHNPMFEPHPPLHTLCPPYGEPFASCTGMFGAFAFVKRTTDG